MRAEKVTRPEGREDAPFEIAIGLGSDLISAEMSSASIKTSLGVYLVSFWIIVTVRAVFKL